MYSGFGLVQLFLFRLQLYQVKVPVCMFGPAQPTKANTLPNFAGNSVVRSRSLPASLTVVRPKSYT